MSAAPRRRSTGFTLIELLVVIGIIILLVSILLPVVSRVRLQAAATNTEALMSKLTTACQNYYHDWNAYPGPVANVNLAGGSLAGQNQPAITGISGTVTSSENLVLGLLGFLTPPTMLGASPTYTAVTAGQVPTHAVLSLNPLHPESHNYFDYVPEELSPGLVSPTGQVPPGMEFAAGQKITDTNVPEFIDTLTPAMPILYIRASAGNPASTGPAGAGQIADSKDNTTQYNYSELQVYGSYMRLASGSRMWLPFNDASVANLYSKYQGGLLASDVSQPYYNMVNDSANPKGAGYLANPNVAATPRGKDTFILISAGIDRTYGTRDDIIVTP